jgi:hypothetical protein
MDDDRKESYSSRIGKFFKRAFSSNKVAVLDELDESKVDLKRNRKITADSVEVKKPSRNKITPIRKSQSEKIVLKNDLLNAEDKREEKSDELTEAVKAEKEPDDAIIEFRKNIKTLFKDIVSTHKKHKIERKQSRKASIKKLEEKKLKRSFSECDISSMPNTTKLSLPERSAERTKIYPIYSKSPEERMYFNPEDVPRREDLDIKRPSTPQTKRKPSNFSLGV